MRIQKLTSKLMLFGILICFTGNIFGQNINKPNIVCPMGLFVNSYSGNLFFKRTDIHIPSRKIDIDLSFFYNSAEFQNDIGYGNGWRFTYGMQYQIDSSKISITWNDGRKDVYEIDSTNHSIIHPPLGIFDSLVNYLPGKYKLITKNKMEYFLEDSTHRRLTRITEPNGNFLQFTYSDSLLNSVADGFGRTIQLVYTNGHLTQLNDANGIPRAYTYSYDGAGNLISVTDPLGNSHGYGYIVNGPLSDVTDKNGNVVNVIYNSSFAVKEVISCNNRKSITYSEPTLTTHVIDYVGNGSNQITSYKYNSKGNLISKEGNCCGYNVSYEFDDNNNISKLTDANGKSYYFVYDSKGNLLSETDPLGNTERFTYESAFNQLLTKTDKKGNTTTLTYDANGNLTQKSSPLGKNETYTYSSNGDLISYSDALNNNTSFVYDSYGNLITENKPLNSHFTYTYDNRGRRTSMIDPNGNVTSYAYDLLDRTLSITDALNGHKTLTYDNNGNVKTLTDANGHIYNFDYDSSDRLVLETNPAGKTKSISYDDMGNIISIRDENGVYSTLTYDNLNRLISKTNGAGEQTQFSYDGNGNKTSAAYPNGQNLTMTYDALNRLLSSSDGLGTLTTNTYDANGNLISQSDGNNNITSNSYDALNRLISINDPMGNPTTLSYDLNDNVLSKTDRNGHTTSYTYDALNRQISKTDARNFTTNFTYDPAGNLLTITDANNHTTTYTFDALNRNTRETFADGTHRDFTYDANSNILTRNDGNGATTTYIYDDLNRLVKRDYPGTNDDLYTYNDAGKMISAINNDATVTFSYDNAYRITAETLNGKVTGYDYDISNNKRTLHYPGGRVIEEDYDSRSRLLSVNESGSPIATFEYDSGNRNTKLSYANGTNTSMIYDANDRMISMISNPGGFINYNFGYDNEGNKLYEKKNHRPDFSEQYQYDNENQLIDFKRGILNGQTVSSPITQTHYNYDGLGNRTTTVTDGNTTTYSINSVNSYLNITGASTLIPTTDNNGNLTFDGNLNHSYDSENKLISADNGSLTEYKYDALGRRVAKIMGAQRKSYYYSGQNSIEERDVLDSITASFTFGNKVDELMAMDKNGSRYYYHQSKTQSVLIITNSVGLIIEKAEYAPFGSFILYTNTNTLINSSIVGNNNFFCGREYDSEIGKYNFRYREYYSSFGSFNQFDPFGNINGFNSYSYVGNNPVTRIDPLGLKYCPCPPFMETFDWALDVSENAAGFVEDAFDAIAEKSGKSTLNTKTGKIYWEKPTGVFHGNQHVTVKGLSNVAEKVAKKAGAFGEFVTAVKVVRSLEEGDWKLNENIAGTVVENVGEIVGAQVGGTIVGGLGTFMCGPLCGIIGYQIGAQIGGHYGGKYASDIFNNINGK